MLQNEIPIYEHELFEHYRLIGWSMLDWKKSLGAWACRLIQQLLGLPVLIVELGLHASNAFLLGLGCHRRGEQTSYIYIYILFKAWKTLNTNMRLSNIYVKPIGSDHRIQVLHSTWRLTALGIQETNPMLQSVTAPLARQHDKIHVKSLWAKV